MIRTTTGKPTVWHVQLVDTTTHEVEAVEVDNARGWLTFFTGTVVDEAPVVAAQFRATAVLWWRLAA